MGLLSGLLTLPALGPPRLAHWLARTMADEAGRQFLDEGRVRDELLELQQRYDAGEIKDEEYGELEQALLAHLNAIREAKKERSQQG